MNVAVLMVLGDEEFTLAHVSVQEVAKVCSWTGYKNRGEWFRALLAEEPNALIAAYLLVKQRKGETARFTEVDFDTDTLDVKLVDETGREVEPLLEKNQDGSIKTDPAGAPVEVLDAAGQTQWLYSETGDLVHPPMEAAEPMTSSVTPLKPGNSGASGSGTPTTGQSSTRRTGTR